MESKLDTMNSTLDAVSSELGMLTGKNISGTEEGYTNLVTVGVAPELARFTITVSFYQGDAADNATVLMSQDGFLWNLLVFLNPGAGEYVTYSTTVVCQKILIQLGNVNTNWPGSDPEKSTVRWAISAVGTPDSPSLTVY
jgi:hypothetical protein